MSMYDNLLQRMDPDNKKWSPEKIVILAISITLAIVTIVLIWTKIDRVPASFEDYKSLYNYLESIQGKPEEFFNREGNISVKEDSILYEIENEECKMTGIYNNDFQLINTLEEDKMVETFEIVFVLALVAAFVFLGSLVILYIVIGIIEILIISIILRIKKIAKK